MSLSYNYISRFYQEDGSTRVRVKNKLYFRGARIFKAIMEDLRSKGMKNAENAILSGTSAGGLATILNCDKFKCLLPENAIVKCVADASFFINGKSIYGTSYTQEMYQNIVNLHESSKNLPLACTSAMEPNLGGGWCDTIPACLYRSTMHLGSTKKKGQLSFFGGILQNTSEENPEFQNWNRVRVKYYDGSSFTGDVEQVHPAILSGTSTRGLATILNCDKFKCLLPENARVKCVADASFMGQHTHSSYNM
ncbi:hypothetical protein MTR67_036495 [Solanum verrucosum]|uniref:Pectin acetylesterase n=1 Tax=Solanum verrucosum TaxID=315347 RepID=A0AAF0UC80_SOLVR|nr:hypothetical protein MTR67_036495 [Solanum verrucosum]